MMSNARFPREAYASVNQRQKGHLLGLGDGVFCLLLVLMDRGNLTARMLCIQRNHLLPQRNHISLDCIQLEP